MPLLLSLRDLDLSLDRPLLPLPLDRDLDEEDEDELLAILQYIDNTNFTYVY